MRKIDYVSVFLSAIAVGLCWIDSPLSCFVFVASSTIGLIDSIKNKVIAAALINGLFFALNFGNSIELLKEII